MDNVSSVLHKLACSEFHFSSFGWKFV